MLSVLNKKLEEKYVADIKANPGCSCEIRSFPVKEIPSEIDFEKANILGIYPDEKYGYICFMYYIKKNGSVIAQQEGYEMSVSKPIRLAGLLGTDLGNAIISKLI